MAQLKGFAYTSKDRWVVITPRFTPPLPGGSVGEVRVMMLLFRNAAEGEPRTKVWLDGATISMAGGEALLVSVDGVGVIEVFVSWVRCVFVGFCLEDCPGMDVSCLSTHSPLE